MTTSNLAGFIVFCVLIYLVMGLITGQAAGMRLRKPYAYQYRRYGSGINYSETRYDTTPEQERIIKTRCFWAGLFWPVVAPVWILGWAVYGLYKLVTVPFRKLNPEPKTESTLRVAGWSPVPLRNEAEKERQAMSHAKDLVAWLNDHNDEEKK